jgi:hypothetical protein
LGFRLHGIFAPDETPPAVTIASPKAMSLRGRALKLSVSTRRAGGEILTGDNGRGGRRFAEAVTELEAICQRIESIFWAARAPSPASATAHEPSLASESECSRSRLLTLDAAISLNHGSAA